MPPINPGMETRRRNIETHRATRLNTCTASGSSAICITLLMAVVGLASGSFFEAITSAMIIVIGWGLGVGIHFVSSMSKLKELDGSELEREIEYLKGRTGFNSLEEEKNNDVFKMNMSRIKNQKSIEKK